MYRTRNVQKEFVELMNDTYNKAEDLPEDIINILDRLTDYEDAGIFEDLERLEVFINEQK